MLHFRNSPNWKTQIAWDKLIWLFGTNSDWTKFSIWICSARYRGIWVFGFGGFWGRSIVSGNCRSHLSANIKKTLSGLKSARFYAYPYIDRLLFYLSRLMTVERLIVYSCIYEILIDSDYVFVSSVVIDRLLFYLSRIMTVERLIDFFCIYQIFIDSDDILASSILIDRLLLYLSRIMTVKRLMDNFCIYEILMDSDHIFLAFHSRC